MGRKRDWAGIVQGKLTVKQEDGRDAHGSVLWLCKCECGAETYKSNNALSGGVKSCGINCGVVESNKARSRHGMWRSKEYICWQQLKGRCLNRKHHSYADYGGRGITVHPTWTDSFEQFYADVGPAPDIPRASLDRIDVNGNYEPANVRWTTPRVQSNNRRDNLCTKFRGMERTLADIARLEGIPYHQVFQRYKRGLRGEDLIRKHKIGRKPK